MLLVKKSFRSLGGADRVHESFVGKLEGIFGSPHREFTILNLFRYRNTMGTCVILEGLFFPGNLIDALLCQCVGIQVFVHPRGNRFPNKLFDSQVKSSEVKYLFRFCWSLFSSQISWIFSSEIEQKSFISQANFRHIRSFVVYDYLSDLPIKRLRQVKYRCFPNKIVYLGRFSFEKNLKFAAEVCRLIRVRFPGVRVLFAGEGSFYDLNCLVNAGVEVCMAITDEMVKSEFLKDAIVIQPSLYESFGLVGLECACYGGFFVVSAESAWPELHDKFDVSNFCTPLSLVVDDWVSVISDLLSQGFVVDEPARRVFLDSLNEGSIEVCREFKSS